MEPQVRVMPVRVARLIILFLHDRLTQSERNHLDEWILYSENNMNLFLELLDNVEDRVFERERIH